MKAGNIINAAKSNPTLPPAGVWSKVDASDARTKETNSMTSRITNFLNIPILYHNISEGR